MSGLIESIVDGYRDMMDKKGDPRVKDWAMMSSPFPTIAICLFYAYFSKVLGPRIMENRKPFDLRKILIVYNLIQSIFSTWIFYEYIQSGWFTGYSFRCQPVDYSNNPKALRMANTCWWYYFSKFTEFLDTFFFILRKKNSQVSNLHVIHHGIMPFSVWLGLKFAPDEIRYVREHNNKHMREIENTHSANLAGGHSTFFAFLNTFVHIVMYFYYMISAMGPKYQKYIWWKKYLTTFQMTQFVAIFIHQFQLLFTDCNYPKYFMVWIGFHGVLFLLLFSDFYKTRYLKEKPKANSGACMPIEDDSKKANGEAKNGGIRHQFECNNEYTKVYTNCYTDSSSNGYIKQDGGGLGTHNKTD